MTSISYTLQVDLLRVHQSQYPEQIGRYIAYSRGFPDFNGGYMCMRMVCDDFGNLVKVPS